MAKLVDSKTATGTNQSDNGSDSVTLTTRQADRIHIFVDDGADPPSDHAGYELQIDVKVPEEVGHDMRYTTLGSDGSPETARSWDLEGLPNEVTITLVNRSGGAADYALHAIAVEDA